MIPAEKTSQRKNPECHIFQELDQLPMNNASKKMDGIGPKKAIQVRYRLGISGKIKIKELTKYQIDQIEQMIGQDQCCSLGIEEGRTSRHRTIPFLFLVIVEFVIKMDRPYAVNEVILMLGLVRIRKWP
jgi:ribosomal protein S13